MKITIKKTAVTKMRNKTASSYKKDDRNLRICKSKPTSDIRKYTSHSSCVFDSR